MTNLAAYLSRIGLDSPPAPDAAGLALLQSAHRRAIAFENLDVRLGRPIRIDSASVFDKLVTRRRGGYCFEQNRLFSDMLTTLGMPNRPLLARVLLGPPPGTIPPRTHVLLLVDLDGEPWIADAGFGAAYVPPLPLIDGITVQAGDGATNRLRCIGDSGHLPGQWLLERADGDHDWQPQYAFDLAPVVQDDLEQCNHWTSLRAGTRFTTLHIVSIALPGGFASLTDATLTIYRDGGKEARELDDVGETHEVLTGLFGLGISATEVAALPLTQPSRM